MQELAPRSDEPSMLFKRMITEGIRKVTSASNKDVQWYAISAESGERRLGHSIAGLEVYSEARLCNPEDGHELWPMIVWLPAPDLPDGMPSEDVYFFNLDGTISHDHLRAYISNVGAWEDGDSIDYKDSLSEIEQRELLERLVQLNL